LPNAVGSPTVSFGTSNPVNITGANAGTATLTIATTAANGTSCTSTNHTERGLPWYAGGGAVLACVFLMGIPGRRRWQTMLGILALLVAFTGGTVGCNGGGGSTACNTAGTAATTAGTYTVTITGTSGTITENTTVTVTVQ
jgi:hypothetical protein